MDKDKNYNIHIWGHGWEIEKYNLWQKLEEFLKFLVSHHDDFAIVSTSEMYL